MTDEKEQVKWLFDESRPSGEIVKRIREQAHEFSDECVGVHVDMSLIEVLRLKEAQIIKRLIPIIEEAQDELFGAIMDDYDETGNHLGNKLSASIIKWLGRFNEWM